MKIYTLGTSHGNPTRSRFHSSTAYETEDGSIYLVDAGAPVDALLLRSGLSCGRIRAVLLTHMHDDHVGGLSSLVLRINKYATEHTATTVVFSEERAIEPFCSWLSVLSERMDSGRISYKTADDGVVYEDENIVATAIRTTHLVSPKDGKAYSFAYDVYFKKEGKRILQTGDLSSGFADFPSIAEREQFDACLCEATHYQPEVAASYFEKARFSRLIFTHIGDRWHKADGSRPAIGEGEEMLLFHTRECPYPVCVAHDGDIFEI